MRPVIFGLVVAMLYGCERTEDARSRQPADSVDAVTGRRALPAERLDVKHTSTTEPTLGFPEDSHVAPDSVLAPDSQSSGGIPANWKDDGRTIDAMVVYTQLAKQDMEADGFNVDSMIRLSIDWANITFANSGIDLRLNLVHFQQVAYVEDTTRYVADIDRIPDTDAGKDIRELRDKHRADVVAIIRYWKNGESESYVTRSVHPAKFAWYQQHGYSSVRNDCFNKKWYCVVHEFGHLLGAEHDPQAAPNGPGLHSDSYGHDFIATRDSAGKIQKRCFGTMMDYYCANNRIFYFSNPAVKYWQVATGVADRRSNTRAIIDAKRFVANYRQSARLIAARPAAERQRR